MAIPSDSRPKLKYLRGPSMGVEGTGKGGGGDDVNGGGDDQRRYGTEEFFSHP